MAYRGIKICVDNYMKLCSPPNGYSDAKVWDAIKTLFNIETVWVDLLILLKFYLKRNMKTSFCSAGTT